MKQFINNFFSRPPVIFPLVACFLLFMAVNEIQLFLTNGDTDFIYKIRPAILILMTIFWIGATLFKKWGALGFLLLTALTVALFYFGPGMEYKRLLDILMLYIPYEGRLLPVPVSIVFAFAILFYYRRME